MDKSLEILINVILSIEIQLSITFGSAALHNTFQVEPNGTGHSTKLLYYKGYTEFGPSEAQVMYRGKVLLARKWQERWNNSAMGSWTKKFFEKVKFNRLYGDFNQVLTSHGVFGAHQERLFGKEGGCPCGEQPETFEHILLK
ncbi:hypothetical protein AVEN_65083-1 [Araneus ventricosus]|uniref:Uncharacterized protein n=1 Tax=Araneus ventricosus TaxID=182803 RepID=A0A4Y2F4T8_ARAVE|nr:hypothetical protein AVEN_65083-1 [Araneus ventricosus]